VAVGNYSALKEEKDEEEEEEEEPHPCELGILSVSGKKVEAELQA